MIEETILGQVGRIYLRGIDSILPVLESANYRFLPNEEYTRIIVEDPTAGLRIYWSEILFRAHLAAATSIVRSRQWVDGMLREAGTPNFLVFAAAMRGLLESAADTLTSLRLVPEALAQHYRIIEDALASCCRGISISSELEDTLIHYSHATKVPKGKDVPDSHRAKTIQEYLSALEEGKVPRLSELYAFLCDVTHPGAISVNYLLHHEDESGSVGWLHPDHASDRRAIEGFVKDFGNSIPPIVMFAFNPGLVTLRVLNSFSLPVIHTPPSPDWGLEDTALWIKCSQHLRTQGAQL